MLYLSQATTNIFSNRIICQDHANCAVRFVNGAIGLDAQAVFGYPTSIAEAGRPVITSFCINFA